MSGYLQRMASAVLNSNRAVHPALGSIFSTATQRRMPENFVDETMNQTPTESQAPEEQSDSSDLRADLVGPASAIAMGRDAEAGPPVSSRRHQSLPSERAAPKATNDGQAGSRPPFQPLVTKGEKLPIPSVKINYEDGTSEGPGEPASREFAATAPESDSSFPAESVSGKASNHASLKAASERNASLTTGAAKTPETLAKPETGLRAYQPLLGDKLRNTSPAKIFAGRSNAFPADTRGKESRRDSTRYPVKSEREPDEIQIHIGRIEVVAVPPAPVREAKPTNKPLSLDDYLKRGSGRPR